MNEYLKKAVKGILPNCIKPLLYRKFLKREYLPKAGEVCFGDLRRLTPIDPSFGFNRGTPIDRYYIDNFLQLHAADIQGKVLEFLDDTYTRKFGGKLVTSNEIMHLDSSNAKATIVGDLTKADHIPSNAFDCIILTQVLLYIYDVKAAIRTLYRILKPGGILLVTLPGILKTSYEDMKISGNNYWRFTRLSAQLLFEEVFPKEKVQVSHYGNVLVATAFLWGLALEELTTQELDCNDPDYEVTITIRAVKS